MLMKFAPAYPRVAFIVRLEAPATLASDVARIEHVIHLFRGYHVPATWVVAVDKSYELLRQRGLLRAGEELALAITAQETGLSHFRESLRKRLSSIDSPSVSLVAGEPSTFRPHAAFLSEQGLRGVITNARKHRGSPGHSPLPCGLWQLDHAMMIPGQTLFSNLLPGSNASQRLNKLVADEQTITISVDAARIAHTSSRTLQNLENLLRTVSHSVSHQEIGLTTTGEIVAALTASRAARPQHSILRAA
jgi:hypothetical protein